SVTTAPPPAGDLAAAAARVEQAINKVRDAQKSGNFEQYGQALKELDEAMTAFQAAQRAAATPAPGAGSPAPTPGG
ncbi:hypothetical protein, partial [Micromonospora echinofusca]